MIPSAIVAANPVIQNSDTDASRTATGSQFQKNKSLRRDQLSTPSIRGMMKEEAASELSEPATTRLSGLNDTLTSDFDLDTLIYVWKSFAENLDAPQLKSALISREPILNTGWKISYRLDNEVQRQRIVTDWKPKLVRYLSQTLKNDLISVDFEVISDPGEVLNKPYTDQEKFNALAARYPALNSLKQRFGLDFE